MPYFDPNVKYPIEFLPINVYYTKKSPDDLQVVNDIRALLSDYQKSNSTSCYITYGTPTFDDYNVVNSLVNNNVSGETQ